MFLDRPEMDYLDHLYRGYCTAQGTDGAHFDFDLQFEAYLKKKLHSDGPSWNKIIQTAAKKRKVTPFVLLGEMLAEFPDAPAKDASESSSAKP